MSRTPSFLVTLLVLGALVACGDDGASGPEPETTTTTVAEVTTTTEVDPFTVPDDPADITVEYVEAVLTELERINGDALRLAMEEGVTPEVSDRLLDLYIDDLAASIANRLLQDAAAGFAGFQRPPGDIGVHVVDVEVARPACMLVAVLQDYSEVALEGAEAVPVSIELVRASGVSGNPTGWVIASYQPADEPVSGGPCDT